MPVALAAPVGYTFQVGEYALPLNELLGKRLRIEFTGEIRCTACDRVTSKSFNQGYCYPCFRKLAACDTCIMSPEKCHYHLGTCREPAWGEAHCLVPHVVYLANSSGLKVGITRRTQVPTRWIDQGAVAALPLLEVSTRRLAGLVEDACRAHVSDRTNWRTMLKGEAPALDLAAERDALLEAVAPALVDLKAEFGEECLWAPTLTGELLSYPVVVWPEKIKTHNLDKHPVAEGVLEGVKGQYLMLDTGVINIRKYTAYRVRVQVTETN
ncbi:MAG: DUF2797 domain-containing protein [Marinobacter sp.]|nr:DUF2797 domain-containing protein [Marinobacter sp.]